MEKENFTSEINSRSTMVDGGFTLATPPAEFIITKINTSTKKNTDREVQGVRKKTGVD